MWRAHLAQPSRGARPFNISYTSNYSRTYYRAFAQFLTVNFSAQDVELSDDSGYSITENTEVASATYKKTLGEERVGKYQAWFVPFDYTITAADLAKFDFFKINMIANAAQPGENPFYYVSVNGNICKGTTVTVGPYRWILRATAKDGISYAPNFSFMENGTTGINDVRSQMEDGRGEVYNLAGQRVSQPTKGLYIVNGKKVVIK